MLQMDNEQQAVVKPNTETDDAFQRMLEIRFDQPLTVKVKFQDDEPDYLHSEEALFQSRLDDHIDEKSPGCRNVIILGTKKTSRRSTGEISDQRDIKRSMSTAKTIINVQNQIVQNNIDVNSEESSEIQKETHIVASEKVLPGNTNSFPSYSENVKNTGTDVDINAYQEILAVNSILSKNYSKPSLPSTSNSEQKEEIKAKEEIKNSYKDFPRTKVTSRRYIKKFPGKMASMKKSIDKIKTGTKNPSLGTIENLADSIQLYSSQKPEHDFNGNDKTSSELSIQLNKSDDVNKILEYQNILNKMFLDAQRSMKGDLRPTNEATNSSLISLQNRTTGYVYDLHIDALKTVAENILEIFPYLNYFMYCKRLKGQDKEILKKAQHNFYECKIKSFRLSYSTVISFILPNKDNAVYMESLYQLITEIAKEKKMPDFSQHNLKILCSEMISWTEDKKLQMKMFRANSRSRRQTGQISNTTPGNIARPQNLQLSSTRKNMPLGSPGNINQSRQWTSKTEHLESLRFPAGPPGREIQITYDSETHRLNEPSTPQSVQSKLNNSAMVKTNQVPYSNQWTSPVAHNVIVAESCNLAPQLVHNPAVSHYDAASSKQTHQQQNTPLQTPKYPLAFESFFASLRPPPQSYHQIQTESQMQQHEDLNANYFRSSVVQERSSVSRDSGFMSPVGDNSAIDQMMYDEKNDHDDDNNNDDDNGDDDGDYDGDGTYSLIEDNFINDVNANTNCPTPMITHLTSMNPNANISPPSKCQVCGTITNLRCLGCNQNYYCGPRCQGLDWRTHRAFCHK